MRGLPLNRLHDPTRRQVRRDTQQQMDMLGPHVSLHDLDVLRSTDLSDQFAKLAPRVAAEHRLAIGSADNRLYGRLDGTPGWRGIVSQAS